MSDNQNYDSEDEAAAAQDRISRIVGGGAASGGQASGQGEELGESEALRRMRERRGGMAQGGDVPRASRASGARPAVKSQQAFLVIGGVVIIGILILLLLLVVLPSLSGGGATINLPFVPTATFTPSATPTLTPTATSTVPPLSLPNLTCIFQGSVGGCLDYCQNLANDAECDAARDVLERQGIDFDVWLHCVAPASGPNVGNPQTCLEDAWRQSHP